MIKSIASHLSIEADVSTAGSTVRVAARVDQAGGLIWAAAPMPPGTRRLLWIAGKATILHRLETREQLDAARRDVLRRYAHWPGLVTALAVEVGRPTLAVLGDVSAFDLLGVSVVRSSPPGSIGSSG